jgi:hypothetical protein
MQLFRLSALIITALISINSFAQQTTIGVQKGQKFLVENTTKMTTSAEVMGQSMENNTDSKTSTIYEILTTGQDSINLKSTVTKIFVNATAMGQTMNFDSEKKDNEGPINEILSKMLNKARGITINNKGTITRQDDTEEGMQAASMGIGGGGNEVTTELYIPALIGKEIKAGDSLTDISTIKKDKYDSRDSGTFRITAIKNGVASISYTGTQVLVIMMEQMGMEMTNRGNNIVKSEIQLDLKTGMVLAKESLVESTISIDAAGMTIPATAKVNTTMKISTVQ